jgi:diguanylate cyclase (GGDEF)-like protein/PAS domain S-box-containing protein
MKSNAAIGLAFSGVSLWLLLPKESGVRQHQFTHFLALLVALTGAATLSEYLFGLNLRIDQLLFLDPTGSFGASAPGRMSPATAAALLATGLALILLNRKTRSGHRPAKVVNAFPASVVMMAIGGYTHHTTAPYRLELNKRVALHTALALFVLGVAIFFAWILGGIAADLTGEGSGSILASRLLPAVLTLPVLMGSIRWQADLARWYGTELSLALLASSGVIIFAVLVWLRGRKMNVAPHQLSSAEREVRELNTELQLRVTERMETLKQQTDVLREQAALLDLVHDSIFVRDINDRITFWNEGARHSYGWTAGQALGRVAHDLLHTKFPMPLEQIEAQVLVHDHWEGELSHTRADESEIIVASRWVLLRDILGNRKAVLEVNTDITESKRAEKAFRSSEEKLTLLVSGVKDYAILMLDSEGRITTWNEGAQRIKGYRAEEIIGEHFSKFYTPEAVAKGQPAEELKIATVHGRYEEEGWRVRKDGSLFWASVVITALCDKTGLLRGFAKVTRDITERKALEDALFAEKERAQVTLNSIGDAVICTDTSGNVSFLNFVAEKMTGWSLQNALGKPLAEVFRPLDAATRETIVVPLDTALGKSQVAHLPPNCILMQHNGLEIPIEDSIAPINDREGRATGAVIVFRDVSVARAMTQQLTHTAEHDFLTGLPHRILLNDRVSQAIVFAHRHGKKVAVLFVDLDRFKHINDSLGHSFGDKLLQSVARRFVSCVRASDTVSRHGGDEFIVLLSEVEQSEDAAISANKLLRAVAEPHSIDQHELHLTASIGLAVYPDDGLDSETLIKNADTAMYQAKENGRQSYKFFKPAMNTRAIERQSIEQGLRRALERQEFALHYQPKISLRTGKIIGAEALIRWEPSRAGAISPAQFIPVAEESGLIVPIGNWVLREACKQARAWIDAGLALSNIAVNISAMEFRNESFLANVTSSLNETGLNPSYLELELTESILMKRVESAESILAMLRALGVKLAIDDFGTGYSSLSYLQKFPVDELKIDQSFIHQITTAHGENAIVTAIISMGHNLNLRVVAEGVEIPEEVAFLQSHQCDEAQGYYFSRPVPAQQFAKLLESGVIENVHG